MGVCLREVQLGGEYDGRVCALGAVNIDLVVAQCADEFVYTL